MIFKTLNRILDKLESIDVHLAELEKRQHAANNAFSDILAEDGRKSPFKLDDAKMQEGIANLMGYDPFSKKRSEE
jgi:hypothetical protein